MIAFGGNAIKKSNEEGTVEEQFRNLKDACGYIPEMIKNGYRLVLTHGNGPQAGNLLIQQENTNHLVPTQPLYIVGAMTQGQLGYMLQQTVTDLLRKAKLSNRVVTVLTRILIDKNDPNFKNPTEPIGPFYDKQEAQKLARLHKEDKNYTLKKVKPFGIKSYRRVVPSPDPIEIIESKAIKKLVDDEMIVVACGGGGIPVIRDDEGRLIGVEAVIDKDLAGEKLAEVVNADIFLILTDIDKAKLSYGMPNEKDIDRMTVTEAKMHLQDGHFLEGSMQLKIVACIRFLESGGVKAVISSIDNALQALNGKAGTHIIKG